MEWSGKRGERHEEGMGKRRERNSKRTMFDLDVIWRWSELINQSKLINGYACLCPCLPLLDNQFYCNIAIASFPSCSVFSPLLPSLPRAPRSFTNRSFSSMEMFEPAGMNQWQKNGDDQRPKRGNSHWGMRWKKNDGRERKLRMLKCMDHPWHQQQPPLGHKNCNGRGSRNWN